MSISGNEWKSACLAATVLAFLSSPAAAGSRSIQVCPPTGCRAPEPVPQQPPAPTVNLGDVSTPGGFVAGLDKGLNLTTELGQVIANQGSGVIANQGSGVIANQGSGLAQLSALASARPSSILGGGRYGIQAVDPREDAFRRYQADLRQAIANNDVTRAQTALLGLKQLLGQSTQLVAPPTRRSPSTPRHLLPPRDGWDRKKG